MAGTWDKGRGTWGARLEENSQSTKATFCQNTDSTTYPLEEKSVRQKRMCFSARTDLAWDLLNNHAGYFARITEAVFGTQNRGTSSKVHE
jgi:hypothetical protein